MRDVRRQMAAGMDPPVALVHVAVAPDAKRDDRLVEPGGVQFVPGRLPHRLRLRISRLQPRLGACLEFAIRPG